MTFNLRTDFPLDINNRWRKRSSIIYEVFEKYKCDIVGVQELNNMMFSDISRNVEGYNIVGQPRSERISMERNDILVSKEHEIIENNTFWLSNSPDKVGTSLWYSVFPRICTTATIRLKGGTTVRIYNTHLDCFSSKARRVELRKIVEYMDKKYEEDRLPVILMGDFNATPGSRLIKDFANDSGSKRRFIAVQEYNKDIYGRSTMSNFRGTKKGRHIDYIFVSEEFEIVNTEIVDYHINGKYPSDHYPIIADLVIR